MMDKVGSIFGRFGNNRPKKYSHALISLTGFFVSVIFTASDRAGAGAAFKRLNHFNKLADVWFNDG